MTVYINNYAKTDYEEDMCLTPLFELLGNIKVKERVDSWAEETKSHTFGISYSGKRAFTSADSLQVIKAESADIDENEDIELLDDFFFINENRPERIVETIISLCSGRLKKYGDFDFLNNMYR